MKKLSKDYARKVDGAAVYSESCPICGSVYSYSYFWFFWLDAPYQIAYAAVRQRVKECIVRDYQRMYHL